MRGIDELKAALATVQEWVAEHEAELDPVESAVEPVVEETPAEPDIEEFPPDYSKEAEMLPDIPHDEHPDTKTREEREKEDLDTMMNATRRK
jgi:hypothetical protein